MSDSSSTPQPALAAPDPARTTGAPLPAPATGRVGPWPLWSWLVLGAIAAGGAWIGWGAQQRVAQLEVELVKRQQDSQTQAQEARLRAKQAEEQAREASARALLLESRLAEVALQRGQVEDLVKSMSRSRDENLLVDIEASLRVAIQQSNMTGSAEPLVSALQTADERLARAQQPRLDLVRRALAKDLDRIKATRLADLSTLAIRLDEAIRLVDEMPLISDRTSPTTPAPAPVASSPSPAAAQPGGPWQQLLNWSQRGAQIVWQEARSLVRITRIDRPEAMLISPDQAFFLRENLKLRLLNARLALLSRQTPTALSDLQGAQQMMARYFDMNARKSQLTQGLMTEVLEQADKTQTPRPDDTLAALTTLAATR